MKTNEKRDLRELTEKWMSMERKTFSQREKAERYYEKNLMQPIIENYIERNLEKVDENVDYLILSVGTSYEPLILNISLLKPRKILFLYTKETETILNKIVNYLKLEVTDYDKSLVDSTDSLTVYQKIKQVYISWDKPEKVYIDFTGGTKTMSAAAALAGSLINVQLVYVGTEKYLRDFRKPEPGSENLYFIDNPIEVFGDIELEKIFALIERHNYAGAAGKLNKLKESIPDPLNRQQINFVYLLIKAYEHWDALEFQPACELMNQLLKELDRDYCVHKKIIMMDFRVTLRNQLKILEYLDKIPELVYQKKQRSILTNRSIIISLMFTMYENALRREKEEKYDMATLLLYRLLEMIEQRRLITYGIYISHPEYENINFSKASKEYQQLQIKEQLQLLKEKNQNLKKELFSRVDRDYLPAPIALLDGYILLAALGDGILMVRDGIPSNMLKRIRSMVSLRNNSIFAHGLGPVGEKDFKKFRDFVEELFKHFCEIEEIEFVKSEKNYNFLNPINSRYFKLMEDRK